MINGCYVLHGRSKVFLLYIYCADHKERVSMFRLLWNICWYLDAKSLQFLYIYWYENYNIYHNKSYSYELQTHEVKQKCRCCTCILFVRNAIGNEEKAFLRALSIMYLIINKFITSLLSLLRNIIKKSFLIKLFFAWCFIVKCLPICSKTRISYSLGEMSVSWSQ